MSESARWKEWEYDHIERIVAKFLGVEFVGQGFGNADLAATIESLLQQVPQTAIHAESSNG